MNIDFYKLSKLMVVLSVVLLAATIVMFFYRGFNLGTEFTGGIEIRVDLKEKTTTADFISKVNTDSELNINAEEITSSDTSTFVIRHILIDDDPIKTEEVLNTRLSEVFEDGYEIVQTTLIGATVSKENSLNAIILSLVVVMGIVLYLTFRFKFLYGFAAVMAVIHDVLIILFFVLLFNMEMNVLVVVAILTIFGYSVNDTIIFFDRVRDEAHHYHSSDYRQLLTLSLNNVFVRTLITSVTTFIVVLALYLSTEGVYREFALLLMIGILTGTYSSIYVVGPIMLYWNKFIRKQI